ncbi:MAG: ankyrin repeat domain-containing protein, partial [Candidatus Staskawiczbacteria bacterium]
MIIKKKIPLWLKLINFINLIPIVMLPIVFFGSIFMFDAPQSKHEELEGWLIFIGVNSYPVLLIGAMFLSFKLYKNKMTCLAVAIPLIVFLF